MASCVNVRLLALLVVFALPVWAEETAPPGDTRIKDRQIFHAQVFLYQRIDEDAYKHASLPLSDFKAQLLYLASEGYNVVPLEELLQKLAEGAPLPEKSVAITLDDGFKSQYRHAWPLLRSYGFPFTLFLASDHHDHNLPDYMSWEEIRELVASGLVTIGNQTASHPRPLALSAAAFRQEIDKAAARFEAELGIAPKLFSYPYGEVSSALRDVVAEAGFLGAFAEQASPISPAEDPFILPRFVMTGRYGELSRFRQILQSLPFPDWRRDPSDPLWPQGATSLRIALDWPEERVPKELACYVNGSRLVPTSDAKGLSLDLSILPKRRDHRITCTYPNAARRWHWLGWRTFTP